MMVPDDSPAGASGGHPGERPASGLELDVEIDAPQHWPVEAAVLEGVVRRAAEAAWREGGGAERGRGRICVTLSGDEDVQALNCRWRGKDAPTNVLSFPAPQMPAPPQEAPFLGDLVLAGGVVRREADSAGVPLEEQLAWLVVHGILHLLGHDHLQEDERRRMEALERRALARLDMASPYD